MSCCCLFITSSSVHQIYVTLLSITGSSVHQTYVMLLSVHYQFLCTSKWCHTVVCLSPVPLYIKAMSYCCLFITSSSVHQSYVTLRSVYQCMCSFGMWTTFVRCGTGEVSATLTTCEHCALPAIRPSPHSRRPSELRPGDSPRQPALGTLLPSSKKPDGLSTVLRPRAEHLVQTNGASLGMLWTQACLHRMMLLMLLWCSYYMICVCVCFCFGCVCVCVVVVLCCVCVCMVFFAKNITVGLFVVVFLFC